MTVSTNEDFHVIFRDCSLVDHKDVIADCILFGPARLRLV